MADLVECLEAAGFEGVRTYIQSGNVVFIQRGRGDVRSEVEAAIAARFGFEVPVIVRSGEEMLDVMESNPFTEMDPTKVHVGFLNDPPDPVAVGATDPDAWSPESFVVHGREVYLHLPQGMGRAKMPSRLKVLAGATIRNWNTITALVVLTSG